MAHLSSCTEVQSQWQLQLEQVPRCRLLLCCPEERDLVLPLGLRVVVVWKLKPLQLLLLYHPLVRPLHLSRALTRKKANLASLMSMMAMLTVAVSNAACVGSWMTLIWMYLHRALQRWIHPWGLRTMLLLGLTCSKCIQPTWGINVYTDVNC